VKGYINQNKNRRQPNLFAHNKALITVTSLDEVAWRA
jgi:hypothetical protein